jgi:hypothetical protein
LRLCVSRETHRRKKARARRAVVKRVRVSQSVAQYAQHHDHAPKSFPE